MKFIRDTENGNRNMRVTTTALILGVITTGLGLLGLVYGEGRIAGYEMNIDMPLDILRLALGGFLIYAATRSAELSRTAFFTFGALLLGMFLMRLLDATIFGLIPNGLGSIDQILHLIGGIGGLALPIFKQRQGRMAI